MNRSNENAIFKFTNDHNTQHYQYKRNTLKELNLEETISNIIDHKVNGQTFYPCKTVKTTSKL